jgi:hypothetical protein
MRKGKRSSLSRLPKDICLEISVYRPNYFEIACLLENLKVLSGQIGSSLRVEPLDRHLKGLQPLLVFNFLISVFEYFKRLQSSEPLHTKMPLIILLVGITGCMGTNRHLFCRTVLQKCGRINNCSWDYGL